MILMQDPSFAFNSVDVPGPNYTMWITMNGYKGMTVSDLVGAIDRANRASWEQQQSNLLNIVINSHGLDGGGKIFIGGAWEAGIDRTNVLQFSFLRGRGTGTIWIVACQAANGTAGKELCHKLAMASGYQVVASESDQDVGVWGSYRLVAQWYSHQIDEFEGTVYGFYAGGGTRIIDPHDDIMTIKE
jgi:hypothetical protein